MTRWSLVPYIIISIFITACTNQRSDDSIDPSPSVRQALDREYTLSDRSLLYFIDAHSQVDDLGNSNFGYELNDIPETMAKNHVHGTILSARGARDWHDILGLIKYNAGIYPSVRTKSNAYNSVTYSSHNFGIVKKKIKKQLDQKDAQGEIKFRAISEALIYHAAKYNPAGDKIAPRVLVPYNDNRVVYIRKRAKDNGWPFVIHIEFRALRSDRISHSFGNPIKGLKQTLADNPDIDFVLNHLGQLSSSEVLDLIDSHDNIYFFTAHVTPILDYQGSPWTIIFEQQGQECIFKDEWKNLLEHHKDRFIFALDNVWEKHWAIDYDTQIKCWLGALRTIQPDTAHAIAHGNAEHMWRLN